MSEYIVTLKQLAILVEKCHGEALVNVDGTPICEQREIAEVVDEPIALNELVRCRDCRYLVEDGSSWTCDWHGSHLELNDGTPPDGFCAWGERRAE